MALVVLGAVWETLGHMLHVRPDVLPTPSRIALEASREYVLLIENATATLAALGQGVLAALALAVVVAGACSSSGRYCRSVAKVMAAAQAVPFLASVPILVVWFGYGRAPEILVVFLIAFPVLVTGMLRGLQSIPCEILDFGRAVGAARREMVMKVQLPSVLPPMLASLRAAVALSVPAATAAEFVLAEVGLGALMLGSVSKMNTPLLLASFLCVTAVTGALVGLIRLAERLVTAGSRTCGHPGS